VSPIAWSVWIALGVAIWFAVGAVAAVLIGCLLRWQARRLPHPDQQESVIPAQRRPPAEETVDPRVPDGRAGGPGR
jgi:hypothetical protein